MVGRLTVAKNISDAEAEATFIADERISPTRLDAQMAPLAVWLIDGYEPTEAAAGVFAAANMGQPISHAPYQSLLHSALGTEIVDFTEESRGGSISRC